MNILLFTPPFTQLNTPYPATMYLKGFLNTLGHQSRQSDLSIEVITKLFSAKYLKQIFHLVDDKVAIENANLYRMYQMREKYIATIDDVILFLQGKQPTLAYQINDRNYLPEASRFTAIQDLEFSFGNMGIVDKAKYLCTLYLEDLGDLIVNCVDPNFGFNRYAERLSQSASNFDAIHQSLQADQGLMPKIIGECIDEHLSVFKPDLVAITIPFLGNLYGALLIAKHLKQHSTCKIVVGGGYVNTELRNIKDIRFFDCVDFISYDDGEAPIQVLIDYLEGRCPFDQLKRIATICDGEVKYINGSPIKDIAQRDTGTPDYSDLFLDRYLSMLEITNPMHRLWSDGRWNKLTLAHGCYWGKCSFCDISLDYIARYEPITAAILCDRMQTMKEQTNQSGFHFVDEAAPPALMGDLAIEILRRGMQVTWWTNIRFEKSFTPDLCKLLKASGCIAVTGGLEVASDRLLHLMEKGVTVQQVTNVAKSFTDAGIMVHAYLMYGFPTQTDQETIDALEVVRQMFEAGILHSAFWHRFAMTAHSPVGLNPGRYRVVHTGPSFEGFAKNDYHHDDPTGANHDLYSRGLKVSLYNYMNGVGFDMPLYKWFSHKTPKTSHKSNTIKNYIKTYVPTLRSNASVYYLSTLPQLIKEEDDVMELRFFGQNEDITIDIERKEGEWLMQALPQIKIGGGIEGLTLSALKSDYEEYTGYDFKEMYESDLWQVLQKVGAVVW